VAVALVEGSLNDVGLAQIAAVMCHRLSVSIPRKLALPQALPQLIAAGFAMRRGQSAPTKSIEQR
jgi:hypothetical protein